MRKTEFNHALTALARKHNTYPALMTVWDTKTIAAHRTAGHTVEAAYQSLLGTPPKAAAKKAPRKTPKKATAKATVKPAMQAKRTRTPLTNAVAGIIDTSEKIVPLSNLNFPCGGAYVVVYIDGRNPAVTALKDNGFTRTGTGEYRRYFSSNTSADAAMEKAAPAAARIGVLLASAGVEAATFAATWVD